MKTRYFLIFVCWVLVLLMSASSAFALDPPGDEPDQVSSLLLFPFSFYQKVISPAVGNRCRMSPSCSAYSRKAFQDHGFFLGWFMTCDRLMRCGRDESDLSPGVWTPEGRLTRDPNSANDFWMK